ncbi:MAG: metallophosphoesterase [Bacteroidales bacterium]|nr:metallophosphoesterase [Bacteroidales bacterium]
MRTGIIVILIGTVLGVAYVTWHLWRITPGSWVAKLLVGGLFLLWMAAAFASMLLRDKASIPTITALYEVGHPWMIASLYLLIAFLLADIGVLIRLIPKDWLVGNAVSMAGILGVIAVVLTAGGIHYKHKYREELTIRTEKALEKPLTIVLASDLHIGYSNRKAELARWINLINAEKPDLVLFGGDLMDIQLRPLAEGNYAEEFHRLEAPAFTVLGNHEYIGGRGDAERFLKDAGIGLLRDSVVLSKGITIIGRDDRSNPRRKPLSELADSLPGFSILLDHQPYHLEEAEAAGIDFQFSGHTHRGQVWPLNWLTDSMYEKSWGFHRRGNTQYYVSSGLGIWGPKIRIGTRSEYLVLHVASQ